ncbi:hypothetical protein E2C01_041667 [Portunus trituberculatus]|uniref:Uncharacterized protein n=1 Tax=Portunus trituberculatus TaxID=210409 RepID=A0A5B7FR96_PORTR|nr:hypothetical protein [Portunus trituberculatus]
MGDSESRLLREMNFDSEQVKDYQVWVSCGATRRGKRREWRKRRRRMGGGEATESEEKLQDDSTCRKVLRKLAHVMHKNTHVLHRSWERFLRVPCVGPLSWQMFEVKKYHSASEVSFGGGRGPRDPKQSGSHPPGPPTRRAVQICIKIFHYQETPCEGRSISAPFITCAGKANLSSWEEQSASREPR